MAKTRQGEVNQLYSQMDVLVAPSLWPESFGLVTREALYAGVWVIASDRGSVGDAIEDGVSGRVVDVSSPEGLTLALREVDANPEPYTRQRPSIKPRLAETQATECVELYRSILRNPVD
jgi:glycosyltransferase involved in cell wall biosynthesis